MGYFLFIVNIFLIYFFKQFKKYYDFENKNLDYKTSFLFQLRS